MNSMQAIRAEFPFFAAHPEIAYLDSSATAQVPACVGSRMAQYTLRDKASPFRGLYGLSMQATDDYEAAREEVRRFIGAREACEIIFTRNASESLNLVAYCLTGRLRPGDEIVVSIAEHHSNFIPWQQLAARTGATVRYLDCDSEGVFSDEALDTVLTGRTRIVAVTQMSNVFGRIVDVAHLAQRAHAVGALLVADGCQSVPHMPVDVTALGVDFLAFSGHKMLCPMGIGALYGRRALLEELPPFLFGGEMIESVTTEGATWAPLPQKFEAGTVNTDGAIALGEAVRFYERVGFEAMMAREAELTARLMAGMALVPHVHPVGSPDPAQHHGIVAFTVDGVHPHDVSEIMSSRGVAIRAGHHCAQPLHHHLGLGSTSRASLMFYNTEEEIDRFLDVLSGLRGAMGYGR